MNFEEIKELIKLVSKTGLGKVQIEKDEFRVTISGSKTSSDQPIIVQSPQPAMMTQPTQAIAMEAPKAPAAEKPAPVPLPLPGSAASRRGEGNIVPTG